MARTPADVSTDELVFVEKTSARETSDVPLPEVGQWFWVSSGDDDDDKAPWLGCVTRQGSNYVKLEGPSGPRCTRSTRIHVRELDKYLAPEPEAEKVIAGKVTEQREVIGRLTNDLRLLMGKLALGARSPASETSAIAICVPGGGADEYKKALITAKDKTVPEIMKQIRDASEEMATWMKVGMIPLDADIKNLERETSVIKKRIFGVELYAGLVEQVVTVAEGAPAGPDEPIWLFQRRHYMDEECLADYDAGGMTFEKIEAFDAWLLRPKNLKRILPYPRCLVAFQVRRKRKEEHEREQSFQSYVRMAFAYGNDPNKQTYLYMRNGDQVFRLETAIEFAEKLFPDVEHSILNTGKLYAIMPHFGSTIERLGTEGEYLDTKRREAEERHELKKVPKKDRWRFNSKVRYPSKDWVLWNNDTVFYDDITRHVTDQLEDHNRLVLVLQGLLDRSQIFHPHPPYKLWVPTDFVCAIRLVHDDSRALVSGDVPNFAAYQSTLNSSLGKGSNTVGQDDFWQRVEAKRENEREDRHPRYSHGGYRERSGWIRYKPDGNPGPGLFAVVEAFSFAKGCTYTWQRERQRNRSRWYRGSEFLGCRLVVPTTELLNLDAYTAGDYHKFYDDPRTRAEYLQWAPLLLPAEEWCANKGKK